MSAKDLVDVGLKMKEALEKEGEGALLFSSYTNFMTTI